MDFHAELESLYSCAEKDQPRSCRLKTLIELLAQMTSSNLVFVDNNGYIRAYSLAQGSQCRSLETLTLNARLPQKFATRLLQTRGRISNSTNSRAECILNWKTACPVGRKYSTVTPLVCGSQRKGTLVWVKYQSCFTTRELLLTHYGSSLLSLKVLAGFSGGRNVLRASFTPKYKGRKSSSK